MSDQRESGVSNDAESSTGPGAAEPFDLTDFVGDQPTRSLDAWQRLWSRDVAFPVKSARPIIGPVLVAIRRLLRPLVRGPQSDLWERQRVFNLIMLEKLRATEALQDHVAQLDRRLGALEAADKVRIEEMMRYSDALYSRVDIKLDSYRELVRQQVRALQSVVSAAELEQDEHQTTGLGPDSTSGGDGERGPAVSAPARARSVARATEDAEYLAFENRERGSRQAILDRIESYWRDLEDRGPVIDLGCGRGEVMEFLGKRGVDARGVDGNSAMVAHCVELGLTAEQADLNDYLARQQQSSAGAVTCFHVIEHLPPEDLNRLLRLAFRVLRPGGLLLLETPNPMSLVVGASAFWVDATHQKPVHPVALQSGMEQVGFADVEIRTAQPFPSAEHLPSIELAGDAGELSRLADQVNRLRDRLDSLLFGDRDFAALGRVPE